jgi:hypothetical protein
MDFDEHVLTYVPPQCEKEKGIRAVKSCKVEQWLSAKWVHSVSPVHDSRRVIADIPSMFVYSFLIHVTNTN